MADLIDQTTLADLLEANDFSAAQVALYPTLAPVASRMIRKWCNRWFNRRTAIDELYTVDPGQPLLLKEFPVNGLERLCTDPTAVLSIANTSGLVQRATVKLASTGDTEVGLVTTGLELVRIASGVKTTSAVAFGDTDTVGDVADAVNALGLGWEASVAVAYELWPASDLRAVQGALPAVGRTADLVIHTTDLSFELDAETGTVFLESDQSDPWTSTRWGPSLSTSFDDQVIRGQSNGLRVVYDAGFDTVPEDVQQACAETVADQLHALATNQRLGSETQDSYSYVLNTAAAEAQLTRRVRGMLSLYRSSRV